MNDIERQIWIAAFVASVAASDDGTHSDTVVCKAATADGMRAVGLYRQALACFPDREDMVPRFPL